MALNVSLQVYRGPLSDLVTLATTGKAGVLAWTTDTNELYVDAGSGSAGIGSGNAWQKIAQDLVAVNAQTSTAYTIAASDRSKLVTLSNAASIAVTLPVAGASFPAGWVAQITNQGVGVVTITPTTSTIDGASSLVLGTKQGITLVSDGTNYFTIRGVGAITPTTAVTHQFVTAIASTGAGTLAQPAFTDISGVASAAQLPNPSASTLGGVESYSAVTHQFLTSISTSGVPVSAQPAFADISGVATAAQLPNPTASTLGGVESFAAVSNQFLTSISTSGVPVAAQPAFSNLSGVLTQAQLPAAIGSGSNLANFDCGSF